MAKAKPKTVAVVVTLADIVAAGPDGTYTTPAVHKPLLEAGFVEINPGAINEKGEIATRATQKGINEVNKPQTSVFGDSSAPVVLNTAFAIEDGVPIPASAPRGRSKTSGLYPFDQLEVGQSFFVGNDPTKLDEEGNQISIAKSLASTVSSATARYAVEVPGQFKPNKAGQQVPVTKPTRRFIVRAVDGGARVWRTE